MLMLSHVEGTCYHQIQPRTDVLWCLCYKPILIQTVCRSHFLHCLFQLSLVIGFWFGKHSARIVLMPLNWNGVRLQQFLASIQSLCLQLVSNADSHWPCQQMSCRPCNLNGIFLRNYAAWVRKAIFVSISIWGLCISSRDKSPSASNIKCIGARQSHLGPRNERYRGGRYQIQLCSWITWEPLQFVHDGTNRSSKSFSLPVVSSSCR